MLLSRLNLRRGVCPALLLLAAGCGSREQITSYTVTKPELIDPTLAAAAAAAEPKPQQVLGAIVVLDNAGWFFKVTGDPAQVEPQREAFLTFVKSVRFSSGADPQPMWDLPEGWNELPGDQFRFATLQMPTGQGPLALAVSVLPRNVAPEVFVLNNVIRWRGQVGLGEIDQDELTKTSETFQVDGHDGTFVSLVGETTGGGMPAAPFAGGAAPGSTTSTPPAGATAAASEALTFETPEGWTPGKTTEFRKAAFSVADGDKKVEITVVPLGAASGTLLENVNRWRGMVGLEGTTDADLVKTARQVETLGVTGTYVELVGTEDTILGVVAPVGGQVWYVKLQGDSKLAERENARFQAFVKSLRLK